MNSSILYVDFLEDGFHMFEYFVVVTKINSQHISYIYIYHKSYNIGCISILYSHYAPIVRSAFIPFHQFHQAGICSDKIPLKVSTVSSICLAVKLLNVQDDSSISYEINHLISQNSLYKSHLNLCLNLVVMNVYNFNIHRGNHSYWHIHICQKRESFMSECITRATLAFRGSWWALMWVLFKKYCSKPYVVPVFCSDWLILVDTGWYYISSTTPESNSRISVPAWSRRIASSAIIRRSDWPSARRLVEVWATPATFCLGFWIW